MKSIQVAMILAFTLLSAYPVATFGSNGEEGVEMMESPSFVPGEKLEFSIRYGFVVAGKAWLEVGIPVDEGFGVDNLEFRSRAESNKVFSLFFKVRDTAKSIVNRKDLCSIFFSKKLVEGDYSVTRSIDFRKDQQGDEKEKNLKGEIPRVEGEKDSVETGGCRRDPLASLYFVRSVKLEPGMIVDVINQVGDKVYPVSIKVIRREKVKVPAGEFRCLVVEPVLKSAGIFRHEGKMKIWFTDDERHMPVLMKTKAVIGSVSAVLVKFRESGE